MADDPNNASASPDDKTAAANAAAPNAVTPNADETIAAVARMTGLIAHDFNNHLAVIMGSLQLLSDRLGPEDKPSRLAFRAAERAARYTARLLGIAGRRALHPEALDTADLLAACQAAIKNRCGDEIAVTLRCADGLWLVAADRLVLREVIDDLATNAVQATRSGGRLSITAENLRVDASQSLAPGDYVTLSFVDNGPGMASDLLARATEPFFSTKEDIGALGLGLSVARGFAGQSGGALTIASRPGQGTSVTLALPRAVPGQETQHASAATGDGQGKEILLVEDNEELRTYIETLLSSRGYRVTAVADAAQALAAFGEARHFDLLLSDVVLTGAMNGAFLAQQVRQADPAIKVLFITGFARGAFGQDEPETSDPVLQKPFTAEQLFDHLAALLAGSD